MELINECSAGVKKSLDALSRELDKVSFTFNTSELIPFTEKGCERKSPAWDRLGKEFAKVPSPILYWFEILSTEEPIKIYHAIKNFKDQQLPGNSFRAVPALKPISKIGNSSILYVGCCGSTTFLNRMFWHFGYYNVGRTQGLQLCRWAQPLNLALKITAVVFPKEAKHLIYVYEKYFAEKMNPIIGKHKG
jgi:hypothetical protein